MNEDNQLEQLIEELEIDQDQVKPIELGKGLIEYRKYLWALKFINEKIDRLKAYKLEVTNDIDQAIATQENNVARIKDVIEKSIIADPIADRTKSGGRTLSLPDIATVSLSKLSEKIDIEDPEAVLDELGEEYKKVKVSLDTSKAKKHIQETGILPKGASKREARTLSIRFKR
jgi:hypothetical protein